MDVPRYARSGGVNIAYQVAGDGPFDLVFVPPFISNVELGWEIPGPARAVRCACEIRDAVAELGLQVRAGLHTGECEEMDGKVGGVAVITGARVASVAAPNEVLVSSTVRDLVAGSGISFEDRGTHLLKGLPEERRLYAVVDA